jgi:tetratricopeptide (TPR) repeat protein
MAKLCLDTERFDTLVPSIGLDLLINIQQTELGLSASIFDDESLLPALLRYSEALEDAAKNAGDSGLQPVNLVSNRARLAALFTLAGELPQARKILLGLANDVSPEPFYRLQLPSRYSTGFVLAATPENTDRLQKISTVIKNGATSSSTPQEFDAALADLKELRKSLHVEESDTAAKIKQKLDQADWTKPENIAPFWIQSYVLHTETILNRLRAYSENKWVKLTVDEQASGWEVSAAQSKCLPPDGIELTSAKGYCAFELRSLARFAPPYDVQVTVEATGNGTPSAGISLGPTDVRAFEPIKKARGMRMFCVSAPYSKAGVWQYTTGFENDFIDAPSDKSFIVRVKAWESGRYQFSVNDLRIVDKTDPEFHPSQDLVFGMTLPVMTNGTVKLKSMQIRRLTTPPPLNSLDYSGIETFARDALAFDDEDAMAHYDLARCYFHQEKYAETLKSLDAAYGIQPEIAKLGAGILKAVCFSKLGRAADAIREYALLQRGPKIQCVEVTSVQINSDYSRLLATAADEKLRQGKLALELASAINRSTNSTNWEHLWILAAAQAESKDFKTAVQTINGSLEHAPADKKEFLTGLKQKFESQQPYHMDK